MKGPSSTPNQASVIHVEVTSPLKSVFMLQVPGDSGPSVGVKMHIALIFSPLQGI